MGVRFTCVAIDASIEYPGDKISVSTKTQRGQFAMAKWQKRAIKLPQNHGWRAKHGNKIFVANRGAVQFEYPASWIVSPHEGGSVRFFDKEEPDDNIRLEVSVIHVPPIDWSDLLLTDLIEDAALSKDSRGLTNRGPFREAKRRDLELGWLEVDFIDPNEDRKAHSRICLARGPGVYSFITIDLARGPRQGQQRLERRAGHAEAR